MPVETAIREQVSRAPTEPGVYLFTDKGGRILYVGKARNLKSRVSSYFRTTGLHVKTKALVAKISNIEISPDLISSPLQQALKKIINSMHDYESKFTLTRSITLLFLEVFCCFIPLSIKVKRMTFNLI